MWRKSAGFRHHFSRSKYVDMSDVGPFRGTCQLNATVGQGFPGFIIIALIILYQSFYMAM